jgi:hypothetical protein
MSTPLTDPLAEAARSGRQPNALRCPMLGVASGTGVQRPPHSAHTTTTTTISTSDRRRQAVSVRRPVWLLLPLLWLLLGLVERVAAVPRAAPAIGADALSATHPRGAHTVAAKDTPMLDGGQRAQTQAYETHGHSHRSLSVGLQLAGEQTLTLTASGKTSGDYFGNAVSVDSNVIVVGAFRDNAKGTNAGILSLFVSIV